MATMQPLTLKIGRPDGSEKYNSAIEPEQCLLCLSRFNLSEPDDFIRHLLETHKLVIGDVDKITQLNRYVQYWRERFAKGPLKQYCVQMRDKCEDSGQVTYYYMLCAALPEDKQLRYKLKRESLQHVLKIQQNEREDSSKSWQCLFCIEKFDGNRSLVLNHMNECHSFNIGHPDNLVNVEEFLSKLHQQLDKLLCLYCEKTFKDRFTLKEHMRKKLHKKLNPNNTQYDKYYLVNYLEVGRDNHGASKKRYTRRGKSGVLAYITAPDSDAEEDWQDCDETSDSSLSMCLFCSHTESEHSKLFLHMTVAHNFDLGKLVEKYRLTFYQQVKIINYIRRQIHLLRCLQCSDKFDNVDTLLSHMVDMKHLTEFVSDKSCWDQPEYYFPTFENDNLLSGLCCDDNSPVTDEWVIPEDSSVDMSSLSVSGGEVPPLIQEVQSGG